MPTSPTPEQQASARAIATRYFDTRSSAASLIDAIAAALAAAEARGAAQQAEVERKYRALLWTGHGHTGLYGDDGEMQCNNCRQWDYRRAPLEELEAQVFQLKLERLAAAQAQPASPSPDFTRGRAAGLREAADKVADQQVFGQIYDVANWLRALASEADQ